MSHGWTGITASAHNDLEPPTQKTIESRKKQIPTLIKWLEASKDLLTATSDAMAKSRRNNRNSSTARLQSQTVHITTNRNAV